MVVSGLPYITPIFSLNWLMKMMVHLLLEDAAVILRNACDIRRACIPTWLSPMSPSSSACGVSAATESMTMMSIAPLLISVSVISSACSPLSGWEM